MSDLINRRKIARALNRQAATIVHNGEEYIRKDAALELVRMSPRVEDTPVVHGRWIYGITCNHEWRKCSECLVSQDIMGCFTYCPNCGAKMDATDNHVGHKDGGEMHESQSV